MGQYYIVINADKKQYLEPHDYGNGMKLLEWSYIGNYVTNALMNLLAGEWKGDHVYVVGDYADLSNENEVWFGTLKKLTSRFRIHDGDYKNYPNAYSLFCRATSTRSWKRVQDADTSDSTARYIYNTATRQVVDLSDCPRGYYDLQIHPVSLLLAIGNGRGGGDYYNTMVNEELVGTWVPHSEFIVVSDEPIPEYADFAPFAPGFIEEE